MTHYQPVMFPVELTVERSYLKDALRAILHTVLFHRVFANIKPRDMDILDLTIPIIDDPEVDKLVDEKIAAFVKVVDANPQSKGQIGIMFYEKRTKRAWFSSTSSEVCWEQWAITINVVTNINEKDKQRSIKNMEKALSSLFLSILRTVNERKDHIPPITTSDGNPFPYQIVIPTASDTWGSMFKRMLDTSASSSPII
ncbi:hypothetical protein BKA57DRAFT_472649 [Linnemannia elongata]|uniref:Autophagy-related protein 101 n=1 Tax=Linnemannia elongata AG-77 TaxID=1314771 RepID=A0A197K332_9FUNG|nr:hypothetical protein BGZ88_008685 [Linnemannia elongata]OAQ32047.1 DUF1649-domain-containing protein [Linnemannia elongata AG-77]KAF9338032.1 hypothetical protein BGZ91_009095 [Linnemannia elongata]KAG0067827.1 hypothetical protein BGZ89_005657 [Linnemannia elongata]KAG0080189.1 hypothetical protein BGZ90_000361 [Linnemannia elongata]